MKSILAIIKKDILIEIRGREIIITTFIFSALVLVLFSFVFPPGEIESKYLASGILWIAFAFSGVLALQRSFTYERDQGCLEGLLLSPIQPAFLYLGKLGSNLIFMLLVEIFSLPICMVLYQVSLINSPVYLALIILLGTIGFASVGSLFSAMTASTRSRELLLPILLFPIVVPVLIASVKATSAIFLQAPVDDIIPWLKLLLGFDIIFLLVSTIIFEYVIKE